MGDAIKAFSFASYLSRLLTNMFTYGRHFTLGLIHEQFKFMLNLR